MDQGYNGNIDPAHQPVTKILRQSDEATAVRQTFPEVERIQYAFGRATPSAEIRHDGRIVKDADPGPRVWQHTCVDILLHAPSKLLLHEPDKAGTLRIVPRLLARPPVKRVRVIHFLWVS